MMDVLSLSLAQMSNDCWDDYKRSLKSQSFPHWDYIIITASNEQQADGYKKQLEYRKSFMPKYTKFAVIPDPEGKRVGSGGATLSAIKYLNDQEENLNDLCVLVIHSGGDSKRIPQYSALGKLFSPIPKELPDGRASTLFDEIMVNLSPVPSRIHKGMMILSGDALLLFNPLEIEYNGKDAAVISFKEKASIGKNHGVFVEGSKHTVGRFLHKQNILSLRKNNAIDNHENVYIDTGAIILPCAMVNDLYHLIEKEETCSAYINDIVRLSLYGDFLYPMAEDSTLEQYYHEKSEGTQGKELHDIRTKLWEVLRPYRLKLLSFETAKFLHFGTVSEVLQLVTTDIRLYENIKWKKQVCSSIENNDCSAYNSIVDNTSVIGPGCYIENSYIHNNSHIGKDSFLSYVEIENRKIPDGIVLHGLRHKNGKYSVRIFGVNDDPKENKVFGLDLDEISVWLKTDLWESADHSLWNANLYPEADTVTDAVDAALDLYDIIINQNSHIEKWEQSTRKSLCSGFNDADHDSILSWSKKMNELVQINNVAKAIHDKIPASSLKHLDHFTDNQKEWLGEKLKHADFSEKIRLHYYIGTVFDIEEEIQNCFKTVRETVLESMKDKIQYNENIRIVKEKCVVELPLRVNFGGGWSDTPPYCMEHGGTVLNMSLLLDDKKPVSVTIEKIPDRKIIFDSRDMDVHGEFEDLNVLQDTGDPFDPFALQKACLQACGVLPKEGHNFTEIIDRIGGGFIIQSEVTNVPKGSGLGTSSILAAACVKAISDFMGMSYTEEDVYDRVLAAEQIMSTGGGWQDQVGGLTPGLKFITSDSGLKQNIKVENIKLSRDTEKKLKKRFALIYTGQRRLARNILRDVMGRYIGNEPDCVYALNEIQHVALLMKYALEDGDIDEFARLMEYHWKLSKTIDEGSSNALIEKIFDNVNDIIDGRMVCGAGGGGFLQVISKCEESRTCSPFCKNVMLL